MSIMNPRPIYMDYQATTPVDPRVVDAMLPYFTEHFGNAASRLHSFGWRAQEAVERARQQVADLIGAHLREIVFTSGATESDNLAIKGVAEAYREKGDHIITVATEHRAVLDPCRRLAASGFRVSVLPVQADGLIDLQTLSDAIEPRTILISVMSANNEIGVLQPIASVGAIARDRGILFHTDAVQSIGKVPFNVGTLSVDLASISAHKMYGPKGVGALYVRRGQPRVELGPMLDGGGHERGLRSGTLNVPGIVGIGEAAELAGREMIDEGDRLRALRDRLAALLDRVGGVTVNGSVSDRLPHNLNVSVAGVEGHELLLGVTEAAISSGSACSAAHAEPSYVLKALGVNDDLARASIRFSLGRFTQPDEVDVVAGHVASLVTSLRQRSRSAERIMDEDDGVSAWS